MKTPGVELTVQKLTLKSSVTLHMNHVTHVKMLGIVPISIPSLKNTSLTMILMVMDMLTGVTMLMPPKSNT
jgi:hypothetical protein